MHKRHVICFGNELQGDDGFGISVYSHLAEMAWPGDVHVFNAGISGLNALRYLEDCNQAILVDALTHCGNVGEVCLLRPRDMATKQQRLADHAQGIPYLLEALKIIRTPLPDILIVGVEIDAVQPFFVGLSDKTKRAVPETVRMIRQLLPE
ncbi:hydrogenase maturation protease [Methylomonas sp. MgM2]